MSVLGTLDYRPLSLLRNCMIDRILVLVIYHKTRDPIYYKIGLFLKILNITNKVSMCLNTNFILKEMWKRAWGVTLLDPLLTLHVNS